MGRVCLRVGASAIFVALVMSASFLLAANADLVDNQSKAFYSFGQTTNNLALSVKLAHESRKQGDPIEITFAIRNSGPPLSIFRVGSTTEYGLVGTGPGGVPIRKTSSAFHYWGSVPSGWHLGTGSTYQHTTEDLGKTYDFRKIGRYTFSFQTAINLEYHLDQTYTILKSNAVTLDVN